VLPCIRRASKEGIAPCQQFPNALSEEWRPHPSLKRASASSADNLSARMHNIWIDYCVLMGVPLATARRIPPRITDIK
jgi:hypothetical protein